MSAAAPDGGSYPHCSQPIKYREISGFPQVEQLLRIARGIDYPEIGDDELTAAADEVLLEYDRRESGD